jgi:hypothetical protein
MQIDESRQDKMSLQVENTITREHFRAPVWIDCYIGGTYADDVHNAVVFNNDIDWPERGSPGAVDESCAA